MNSQITFSGNNGNVNTLRLDNRGTVIRGDGDGWTVNLHAAAVQVENTEGEEARLNDEGRWMLRTPDISTKDHQVLGVLWSLYFCT